VTAALGGGCCVQGWASSSSLIASVTSGCAIAEKFDAKLEQEGGCDFFMILLLLDFNASMPFLEARGSVDSSFLFAVSNNNVLLALVEEAAAAAAVEEEEEETTDVIFKVLPLIFLTRNEGIGMGLGQRLFLFRLLLGLIPSGKATALLVRQLSLMLPSMG
jgi:hypothetical protein